MEVAAGYAAALALGAALNKAYNWYASSDAVKETQKKKHSVVMKEITDCSSSVVTRGTSEHVPLPKPDEFLSAIQQRRASLRKIHPLPKRTEETNEVAKVLTEKFKNASDDE